MVSEGRICDTVCKLASAGKLLPKQLPNGKEPYDGMCDAFNAAFGGEPISIEVWEQAEKNYIKNSTPYISVGHMQEELDTARQENKPTVSGVVEDFRHGLSDEAYWRRYRTAQRIFKFTARMYSMKLVSSIANYLPERSMAIEVGLRHGLTEEELAVPTEKGGQLLAIRCFIAEYYTCKKNNIKFPFVMRVKNHEVEWVRDNAGNS